MVGSVSGNNMKTLQAAYAEQLVPGARCQPGLKGPLSGAARWYITHSVLFAGTRILQDEKIGIVCMVTTWVNAASREVVVSNGWWESMTDLMDPFVNGAIKTRDY